MPNPDDFATALARVFELLAEHPLHHPSVRVALAETMATVESAGARTWQVGAEGLESSGGVVAGTRRLAQALERTGVVSVEIDPGVTSEELERFLADARRGVEEDGGHDDPRESGPAASGVPVGPSNGAAEPPTGAAPEPSTTDVPEGAPTRDLSPALARSVTALFAGSVGLQATSRPASLANGAADAEAHPSSVEEEELDGPETFAEAVSRFAESPDARWVDVVLETAAAEDPDTIAAAVERLALEAVAGSRDPRVTLARRLSGPRVLRQLAGRMAASRDPTRRSELIRVAVLLDVAMARALGTALSEARDRSARRCYMDALVAFGPSGLETVQTLLRDARWFVVRNGVRLLPDVAGRSAVDELAGVLSHPDPRVRREGVTALSRLEEDRCATLVSGMLVDGDPDVRSAAAVAMGVLGGPEAGPALSRRLDEERDADVTVNLIRALSRVGHTDAVPQLERRTASRLFSRVPKPVKIAALRALWSLGTPPARSAVMQALDDRDPEVRGSVRALLGGR